MGTFFFGQGDIFVGQGDIYRTRGHFLSDKGTFLSDKGTFLSDKGTSQCKSPNGSSRPLEVGRTLQSSLKPSHTHWKEPWKIW